MGVLMVFVIPKFKEVFSNLSEGKQLPAFTRLVLGISEMPSRTTSFTRSLMLRCNRPLHVDHSHPGWARDVGQIQAEGARCLARSSAKSPSRRFTRTLGTLVSSGVPILQALNIVKETAGNVVIANAVSASMIVSRKARPSPPRSRLPTCFRRWSSAWWTSVNKPARSRKCC